MQQPTSEDPRAWSSVLPARAPFWLPLYTLTLGLCYQTTYWWSFDVNVMAYLGLEDLVRLSLVPLALLVPLIAVQLALQPSLMKWLGLGEQVDLRNSTPPVPRRLRLALVLALCIASLAFLLLDDKIVLLILLAGTIPIWIAFSRTRRSSFLHHLHPLLRDFVLGLLICGPPVALTAGGIIAHNVRIGTIYTSVEFNPATEFQVFGVNIGEVRYIGHINDYDFFFAREKTYVVRSTLVPTFSLQPHSQDKLIERLLPRKHATDLNQLR